MSFLFSGEHLLIFMFSAIFFMLMSDKEVVSKKEGEEIDE